MANQETDGHAAQSDNQLGEIHEAGKSAIDDLASNKDRKIEEATRLDKQAVWQACSMLCDDYHLQEYQTIKEGKAEQINTDEAMALLKSTFGKKDAKNLIKHFRSIETMDITKKITSDNKNVEFIDIPMAGPEKIPVNNSANAGLPDIDTLVALRHNARLDELEIEKDPSAKIMTTAAQRYSGLTGPRNVGYELYNKNSLAVELSCSHLGVPKGSTERSVEQMQAVVDKHADALDDFLGIEKKDSQRLFLYVSLIDGTDLLPNGSEKCQELVNNVGGQATFKALLKMAKKGEVNAQKEVEKYAQEHPNFHVQNYTQKDQIDIDAAINKAAGKILKVQKKYGKYIRFVPNFVIRAAVAYKLGASQSLPRSKLNAILNGVRNDVLTKHGKAVAPALKNLLVKELGVDEAMLRSKDGVGAPNKALQGRLAQVIEKYQALLKENPNSILEKHTTLQQSLAKARGQKHDGKTEGIDVVQRELAELKILQRLYQEGDAIKLPISKVQPNLEAMIASRCGNPAPKGCFSAKDRAFVVKCFRRVMEQKLHDMVHDQSYHLSNEGLGKGDLEKATREMVGYINSNDFANALGKELLDSLARQIGDRNAKGSYGTKKMLQMLPTELLDKMDLQVRENIKTYGEGSDIAASANGFGKVAKMGGQLKTWAQKARAKVASKNETSDVVGNGNVEETVMAGGEVSSQTNHCEVDRAAGPPFVRSDCLVSASVTLKAVNTDEGQGRSSTHEVDEAPTPKGP